MSKSKHIDGICAVCAVVMVLATLLIYGGGDAWIQSAAAEAPYVEKLFSTDRVHTVDIVAEESDWEEMLQNAAQEEYISCTVVIDGESRKNVGIRPKGNSSLRSVASSDSDRYSFKLEFDHYDTNTSYYGLDKLCLNNCIQDNTYMKDYLCYQMMNKLGADSPLASFAWITVNGEDWGLYVAVEGVEEAFAQRNYGTDHGQIYKPDSMDMGGGGRGAEARKQDAGDDAVLGEGPSPLQSAQKDAPSENTPVPPLDLPDEKTWREGNAQLQEGGFGGGKGMEGSEDVLLVYTDDDPESYPNIFDNAVFDTVSSSDQQRLIASIKKLNQGDVEGSLNIEEVLRYFAVHNFVLNGDSYTGSIIHNYYLYEEDGLLSMIAWDYNLAFGGMGTQGASSADAVVNSPIDSPVSGGGSADRPMVSWIFSDEAYTRQYHQVMDQFLRDFFESGYFETMMEETVQRISPYVEKDPTAFCTYAEFQQGVETLKTFCLLRAQSVRAQLEGTIPSTQEGQSEDSSNFVDASQIALSHMGSQGGIMDGGFERGQTTEEEPLEDENAEQAVDPLTEQETGNSLKDTAEQPKEVGENGERTEGENREPPGDGPFMQGMEPPGEGGQAPENGPPGWGETSGDAPAPTQEDPLTDGSEESTGEEPPEEQQTPQEPAPAPSSGENAETQEGTDGQAQQENNGAPAQNPRQQFGNMPENGTFPSEPQESAGTQWETWALLAASALALFFGLLFAKLYH